MQNHRYTEVSPTIKNRWPSPTTPNKKTFQKQPNTTTSINTYTASSPNNNNAFTPSHRSPRRLLLPTSPQKVELLSSPDKTHLPMVPFSSPPKRRQAPKAKNSSMILTGLHHHHHHHHTEVLPRMSAFKNQPKRWHLWVVLVLSLVILAMGTQSQLTRNAHQQDAFFHDLPRRQTIGIDDETTTGSRITDDASMPKGETHSATEGVLDGSNGQVSHMGIDIVAGQEKTQLYPEKLPLFAVVHVLVGESDTFVLDLYTIVASTLVQRLAGSQAQVVLYITGGVTQLSLSADYTNLLETFQIQVNFIAETPNQRNDVEKKTLSLDVFRRFMSDLAHYERILYMKPNILARGSLDYLYHASQSGLLQENILFADRQSPASTDIFLVRPTNDTSHLVSGMFHPDNGWGHAFQSDEHYELLNGRVGNLWDFVGADDTPGVLYHYARFERGRVSIVLQDAIHSMAVVDKDDETTFESLMNLKDPKVMALTDFRTCWSDAMDHMPCRVPHNTFVRMGYTTATRPVDLSPETANKSPAHFWHNAMDQVKAEYSKINYESVHNLIADHSKKSSSRFAYAFVVGGCDPDNDGYYKNFIYQVLINAFVLKEASSSSDIVLFVQMAYDSIHDKLPAEDVRNLDKMNVSIRYIEKYKQESFDSIIMDKFRVLQLTQYERVMFCDSDVMLMESMDYLFDLSERGVLRSNVVFATELVPATGHIFMLSPLDGDWDHIMEIGGRGGEVWNDIQGWGHPFAGNDGYDLTSGTIGTKWDFPGANADQGLLYHWVKYEEQDGSIFIGDSIQNWREQRHEATLTETLNLKDVVPSSHVGCWEEDMDGQPCRSPYNQYIHFSGNKKPWLQELPEDLSAETSKTSALHFWFHTLSKVNDHLGMGLDIKNWQPSKLPSFGLSLPLTETMTVSALNGATNPTQDVPSPFTDSHQVEHKFAYAYVIGGVLPEKPSYRNYFNDIMISTYNQREEGSKADVVVFVQMAYKSQHDVLPEDDLRLLNAMNITIKYIPKAEDESFFRIMLDKFRVLGLTEYSRVIFMDGDVMALGNLDYLFELSIKGILKENVVFAGITEPANGGFFLVTPKEGATDHIRKIISEKEERGAKLPYPHWDNAIGWGHELEDGDYIQLLGKKLNGLDAWSFYGSFADQGLLYHWAKYVEKSVSIVFRTTVENWIANAEGRVHLEETLSLDIFDGLSKTRKCWKSAIKLKPCRAPHSDFVHFTGTRKPWLKGPPEDYQTVSDASPEHYWFYILSILNNKLAMGLDFENWRKGQRPELGLFPTKADAAKTSYT